jgi:class 3 adenylate cyclase
MSTTRRLAAILAVDVAGYSRLMGEDEEGTLAALRAVRRELGDPKIAEHRGRIVKTTGDGLLAEFASVVDAVRCAVEVQREMIARNAAASAGRRIEFRIGINVGDIIIEDDDILGDGVNIAARLEALAEPGGICLSSAAHEQVRDRLDLTFDDLGEQQVKNITRPVRAYRIALGAPSRAALAIRVPLPLPDKPSLAVLPFQNLTGDAEQEYFVDRMVEEITTASARLRWLFVIARNSAFTYKGGTPTGGMSAPACGHQGGGPDRPVCVELPALCSLSAKRAEKRAARPADTRRSAPCSFSRPDRSARGPASNQDKRRTYCDAPNAFSASPNSENSLAQCRSALDNLCPGPIQCIENSSPVELQCIGAVAASSLASSSPATRTFGTGFEATAGRAWRPLAPSSWRSDRLAAAARLP